MIDEVGREVEYDVRNRMYGQCWTLEGASDAMWRIYSSDRNSVRIRTTINHLLDSICSATVDRVSGEHCVGKVEYLRDGELIRRARKTFTPYGEITFEKLFSSLLLKRRAFKHEDEVRLIFCDWAEGAGEDALFRYDIDPHDFISQIMIDPRVPYEQFKAVERDIRDKTLYRGEIKRSLLYRLPESLIFNVQAKKQ